MPLADVCKGPQFLHIPLRPPRPHLREVADHEGIAKFVESKAVERACPAFTCQVGWSGGLKLGLSSVFFVSPYSADDTAGEVALVGLAGFASGLAWALPPLAGQAVRAGVVPAV